MPDFGEFGEVPVTDGEVTSGGVTIMNEQTKPSGNLLEALGADELSPHAEHSVPDAYKKVFGGEASNEDVINNPDVVTRLQLAESENRALRSENGRILDKMGHENKELRGRLDALDGNSRTPQQAEVSLEEMIRGRFGPDADVEDPELRARTTDMAQGLDITQQYVDGAIGGIQKQLSEITSMLGLVASGTDFSEISKYENDHPWLANLDGDAKTAAIQSLKSQGTGGGPRAVGGMNPADYVESSEGGIARESTPGSTEWDNYRNLSNSGEKKMALKHALRMRRLG